MKRIDFEEVPEGEALYVTVPNGEDHENVQSYDVVVYNADVADGEPWVEVARVSGADGSESDGALEFMLEEYVDTSCIELERASWVGKSDSKNSKWLLVKASIQSEWDRCTCALVTLSKEEILKLKLLRDKASVWLKDLDMAVLGSARYVDLEVNLLVDFMNLNTAQIDSLLDYEENHTWVEYDEAVDNRPENRYDTVYFRVYAEGGCLFVAWGNTSGEELSTNNIDLEELLDGSSK